MTPAVIVLAFDPIVRLNDTASIRIETLALAVVLLLALALAARVGAITPSEGPYVPAPTLRRDDLLFIVLGAVPGAVIGGRIEYVLLHADYYLVHPAAVFDPAQGALSLAFAVLGGLATAVLIARMIGAPVGRWMHAAALPLLFALAAGKLVGVLGASGQGSPADLPWATAYAGPGPWGSLVPQIPSHPSQVYEALATTAVIVVFGLAIRAGAFARRDGAALLVAIALWAVGRAVVVLTWRDVPLAGAIRAEHLVLAAVVVCCSVGAIRLRGGIGSRTRPVGPRPRDVEWPDPESRPTF